MANPNIVNVTSIYGNTAYVSIANTSTNVLLSNSSGSNTIYKVNSIVAANDNGTSTANITVSFNDAANGAGTSFKLAHQIDVAQKTSLVILDKNSNLYLTENTSITVLASAANYIDVICSYEVIS